MHFVTGWNGNLIFQLSSLCGLCLSAALTSKCIRTCICKPFKQCNRCSATFPKTQSGLDLLSNYLFQSMSLCASAHLSCMLLHFWLREILLLYLTLFFQWFEIMFCLCLLHVHVYFFVCVCVKVQNVDIHVCFIYSVFWLLVLREKGNSLELPLVLPSSFRCSSFARRRESVLPTISDVFWKTQSCRSTRGEDLM